MTAVVDLGTVLAEALGAATALPSVDFHTGQVLLWDPDSSQNSVRVLGTTVYDLPVLSSAGTIGIMAGVTVGLLKVKTQYFILGRVVTQASGLVNPQFPIVMYPQFMPDTPLGDGGYATVPVGTLVTWEGRGRVTFPFIEVDGIWGNSSGSGSTTYEVKIGGTTVGSWVSTSLEVSRHGPYDISDFIGADWIKVEVAITSSTGTGQKAVQMLGCYFRDSP